MIITSFYAVLSIAISSPNQTTHISVAEFIERYGQEGIELLRNAEQDYTPSYSLNREGDTLRIDGDITHSMHEEIARYLSEQAVKRIIISSPGGDIDAGINIGFLIHQYNIDIEIVDTCNSSCANYLFTAAANKTIHDGATVIWHGNSQQKDFREFDLCGRTVSSFDGLPMDDDEVAELNTPALIQEWEVRRQREQDFYQLIGVSDYIARVGQEPEYYGNFTMSVKDMLQFGVTNVQAAKNYGEVEYCDNINKTNSGALLSCIAVTPEHFKYEQYRKQFGEVCADDGTLIINNTRQVF